MDVDSQSGTPQVGHPVPDPSSSLSQSVTSLSRPHYHLHDDDNNNKPIEHEGYDTFVTSDRDVLSVLASQSLLHPSPQAHAHDDPLAQRPMV